MPEKILVALGGNALIKTGQIGTIQEQRNNLEEPLSQLVELIRQGHQLVVTHGNGPQVGHILIRVEEARGKAYDLPLDVCVAQSQGEIGCLIQQGLHNLMQRQKINRPITTVVSQVVVDADDPRMKIPTKPIGPFYTKEQIKALMERGYDIAEDAHRGYRRVVPSPLPIRIVESEVLRQIFESGTIVIAVGGGGIPVSATQDDKIKGVEAIIDKDWSSSLLAIDIGAERLLNLTSVDYAKLHFESSREQDLELVTVSQAKQYLAEGHFLPGSMEPKMEAAVHFLENGGREVIITSPNNALQGFRGKTGTHVVRN
ncbi:MAG: carbamate kinase [Nitrospirales bacterium]|nr:carbamate kinase [Nitrospirales bacterium]